MITYNKKYKFLIIILILFIVYNLFFLNKAIHIDGYVTLTMAKDVKENLFALSNNYVSNPVLLGYYYAPILKLFGESETAFHIFHLPFSLLIIISMYFLSLRFTKGSFLPVLFLISTPAFIVNSQNIMQDIPMLSFFLVSVSLFVYGTDRDDKLLLILSGILTGMAILTKYSGLLLIPILTCYCFIFSKKRNCLYLIIPILIFLLWSIYTFYLYGNSAFIGGLIVKLKKFFNIEDILVRTLAGIEILSSSSIISILLVCFLLKKKNLNLFLFSLLTGTCIIFLVGPSFLEYTIMEKFMLAIFFVSSLFIIMIIFKTGLSFFSNRKENKDNLFLSFWFFLILIFTIFIQFIAARFVLILFPPMFLVIYNQIQSDSMVFKSRFRKSILVFIIITFIISTIVAIGDYHYAGIYRDIVSYVKELDIAPQNQIYFLAAGWGYNYYIIKRGYKLLIFPQFQAIYIPTYTWYWWYDYYRMEVKKNFMRIGKYKGRELIEEQSEDDDIFIVVPTGNSLPNIQFRQRVLNNLTKFGWNKKLVNCHNYFGNIILHHKKFHTGFYSHDWGFFPFKLFSRKQLMESFKIYKIFYENNTS